MSYLVALEKQYDEDKKTREERDLYKGLAESFYHWTLTNYPEYEEEYKDDVKKLKKLLSEEE